MSHEIYKKARKRKTKQLTSRNVKPGWAPFVCCYAPQCRAPRYCRQTAPSTWV